MSLTIPDTVIHFPNDDPIDIYYKESSSYVRTNRYDAKAMAKGNTWHQVIVMHMGRATGMKGRRMILDAIYHLVEDEEIFPVAYTNGRMEDKFLVRQCQPALDKLFAHGLLLQLADGQMAHLKVLLNAAVYKFGQINPITKISVVLNRLMDRLERMHGEDKVLNLSHFAENKEFIDIIVNLGNRGILERICNAVYCNDDKFRNVNGLILADNGITSAAPLKVFKCVVFGVLDLRHNELLSGTRLAKDLMEVRADKLLLEGNPVINSPSYPDCLRNVLKNFKTIDGIPSQNLNKDFTPLDKNVDMEFAGYVIDWSNKLDMIRFQDSDDWHAVMIPDPEHEFTKEEIFDYFFITISPECCDLYPCYYKFADGEHQFLVRQCYDQLKHLADECNLEIKIPRLIAPPPPTLDGTATSSEYTPQFEINKTVPYYYRMNISKFKPGQLEPMLCIEKALTRRFNAMERILNLDHFQRTEGLENIVINLTSPSILARILKQAARKFLSSCIELRLCHNKITGCNGCKSLDLMSGLKAIDLGNNWIHSFDDIRDLKTLGLKSLRLDGNPLCANFGVASEYIAIARKYFPALIKLDNMEISTKGNLSSQRNFLCDVKGYDFVEQFIKQYFSAFEGKERVHLKDLYSPKATFSMTCKYDVTYATSQITKRLDKYTNLSRNILEMKNYARAVTQMYVGPTEIIETLLQLPHMMFDMLNFTTDTTIFKEDMIVITVNGMYLDQAPTLMDTDILMAFSRTFVLIPSKRGLGLLKCAASYQIVNDQLNVFKPTPTQTKNGFKYSKIDSGEKSDDKITVADKEALLVMFQEVTQLKTIWATRCLDDGEWNFEKALSQFLQLCGNDEVPDTAFI